MANTQKRVEEIVKKDIEKATTQISFLGETYELSVHYRPKLIEIKRLRITSWGNHKWDRIYFGHIDPIERAVELFYGRLTNPNQ